MTTIKLKKNLSAAPRKESRAPLRPTGVKRPHQTLAQAQAEAQAERDQRRKRWEDRGPQGANRAPQWGDRPARDGDRPPREGEQRQRFADRHRDDRRPPPRAAGPHRAPPQGERPSQPAWAKPQPTGRGAYNSGPRGPQSDTRPGPRHRDDRAPRAHGDRPPRPYGQAQGQSQGDGHTNTYGHRDRQSGPSAERRPYPTSDRRPAPPAERQRTAPQFNQRNDRDVRNDRNDNRQPPRFADRDRRPPGAQDRRPPYAEDRPPASGFGRNDRRPPPMDRQQPPFRADERRPYSPPHTPNQRPAAMPERRPAMPPHPSQAQATPGAETELPRLSKRMSELGLASRREADDWISRGLVRVDGVVVDQLGTRVAPNQHITIDPEAHNEQSKLVTILLHKPLGIVSGQAEDGHAPAATLINADSRWPGDHQPRQFHPSQLHHLVPAGRLDLDSTGLLVLTQDGRVAKMLIGADTKVEKEYVVEVAWTEQPDATNLKDSFPADKLELLRNGLELDRQPLKPAKVSWQNETHLRFVLREGKRRQIRRMCEAVGLQVVALKRIRIGRVGLGDMAPGQWRYLGPFETFL